MVAEAGHLDGAGQADLRDGRCARLGAGGEEFGGRVEYGEGGEVGEGILEVAGYGGVIKGA